MWRANRKTPGARAKRALTLFGLTLLGAACDQPRDPNRAPAAPTSTTEMPRREVVEILAPPRTGGEPVVVGRYEKKFHDRDLEELRARDEELQEKEAEASRLVQKRQREEKEKKRRDERDLKCSLPEDARPGSLDAFQTIPHMPPSGQYATGTCWSFATTSLIEAEIERLRGIRIKLSEMASVYFEYLNKASRFLSERGDSLFSEGSQAAALLRVVREQGVWPLGAFPGIVGEDRRHDHQRLFREAEMLLASLRDHGLWDQTAGLGMLRVLLDRTLGAPPRHFNYEGKRHTPKEFAASLALDPDAYVSFISTLKLPFYKRGEYEVPDNYWHDASYHNLPLDEFTKALESALSHGFSAVLAIDTSEPGRDAENDVMFVPDFDIPPDRIDQIARELRLANGATTDDHGVHAVGIALHAGHNWLLVKDTSRSGFRGHHKGYLFIRDDYIRLKCLAFTVHRDAVEDVLRKFP